MPLERIYSHMREEYKQDLAPHFAVLTPEEFVKDFVEETRRAKNRILLQAMHAEAGIIGTNILGALIRARQKGVSIAANIDCFAHMTTDEEFDYMFESPLGNIAYSKEERKRLQNEVDRNEKFFDILENYADVFYTNPPSALNKLFPPFGRNHLKIYIVDNTAYIGGVNLVDQNFHARDFMVKIKDPEIVHALSNQFYKDHYGIKTAKDSHQRFTDGSQLLISQGNGDYSINLDAGQQVIEKTKKRVRITTPFELEGPVGDTLSKAHKRGVATQWITATKDGLPPPYQIPENLTAFWRKMSGKGIPTVFYRGALHGKLILAEGVGEEEKNVALIGSDNWTQNSGRMHTKELVLVSTNQVLFDRLSNWYDETIEKSASNT